MLNWRVFVIAATGALAGAVLAGCAPQHIQPEEQTLLVTPPDTLSMYKLAGRLGMTVTSHSPSMVSLHDGRNSVVIFAGPEGRLYVNGQAVAAQGAVSPANGLLFVPLGYEPAIRAASPGGGAQAPAPDPAARRADGARREAGRD